MVIRNGIPVGQLTPLRRRRFVPATEAVEYFRTAPAIDYKQFRADLTAIADQDFSPLDELLDVIDI